MKCGLDPRASGKAGERRQESMISDQLSEEPACRTGRPEEGDLWRAEPAGEGGGREQGYNVGQPL